MPKNCLNHTKIERNFQKRGSCWEIEINYLVKLRYRLLLIQIKFFMPKTMFFFLTMHPFDETILQMFHRFKSNLQEVHFPHGFQQITYNIPLDSINREITSLGLSRVERGGLQCQRSNHKIWKEYKINIIRLLFLFNQYISFRSD